MSEHLDKAKGAMGHARELDQANDRNPDTGRFQSVRIDTLFGEALTLARINAEIAEAEALERIADALDRIIVRIGKTGEEALQVWVRGG